MPSDIDTLRPAGTFMGAPVARFAKAGQVVILGIPFDCGTHPTRIGCRLGPSAIRQQSALVRPYYPDLGDSNPLIELEAADLGDVAVVPGDLATSFDAIEKALDQVFEAGATPLTMGGDGAVSLPQLRAASRHHPGLVLLHIDAHTDSYDVPGYNTSSTFTRAAEEKLIDVEHSFHIGARGTLALPGVYAHTRALGYRLVTGAQMRERGYDHVLAEVKRTLSRRPVYLCFDMDYLDPSCAPGVATPTWGGPSAAEALALLHGLAGLNIIAIDVNTVSPPHDVGGMTAFLAGTVMLVGMHLVALGRNRT